MEFTLNPSSDGNRIEVTVVGQVTRAEAAEVTAAHFELGAALGIQCYLIDATRSWSTVGVLDNVHYTLDDIPELNPPGVVSRAAVLVDPADHSHDFHVAFASMHGVDIALFWNRDDAIAWLREAAPRLNSNRRHDPQ